ncbi:MAG TPA: competence protein CoiA family protein [Anaeromyxobacter sp.]|nr:competence protein CoiA family protein [Anaeromyxobacter sp.]
MRRRSVARTAPPPARGRGAGAVQLAWARDRKGEKVRAAALGPAERRARAPFTCLGCSQELIPHLGRVRSPHFAHRPGSSCPLASPETALHQDTKERLLSLCADAFAGRRRVRVLARCPACRRATPQDLAALGDSALAEGAVGSLRADVLLCAGGRPALALEVLVTHAVEPEKEAALAAAGLRAVEIDAREEWEREGEEAGGVDILCARSLGFSPCPACRARERAEAERARGGEAAEVAELEAYRARGLFGGRTGGLPAPLEAGGDPDLPLTPAEWQGLEARFRCPGCGGTSLLRGARIARHACSGPDRSRGTAPPRPVAWRGYDGALVLLGWWQTGRRPGGKAGPPGGKGE